MFDLIAGKVDRPFRDRAPVSKALTATVHVVVIALVVGIPLLRVTSALPEAPSILAFVASSPQPPPPPPPPAARSAVARPAPRLAPKAAATLLAPVEAPSEVQAEATAVWADAGIEGGVPGGIEGGIVGGIVGGLAAPPPPPPPPPPPAPRKPVRIGGQLLAPALTHRVDPVFPEFAAAAHLTGVVILEAVVDTQGRVEAVSVLRSRHSLLDRAAVEALKQWRYSPLVLNGIPTSFILTVTFNFSVGP